jgi:Holliday junction resolvasome RuvABC endonuclease subunit
MLIVGIDPGIDGGVAWLKGHGDLVRAVDMPTTGTTIGGKTRHRVCAASLADMLRDARPDHVAIEKVGGMPTDAAVWAFNFGEGYGVVIGVVTTLVIPITMVQPKAWRKAMGVSLPAGADKKQRKEASRQRAIQLWPEFRETFGRVKDADRAEAALIGRWGCSAAAIVGVDA